MTGGTDDIGQGRGTAAGAGRLLAAVLAVLAVAGLSGMATQQWALARLDRQLEDRFSITAHVLAAEVARLRHLPRVLGEDSRLWQALDAPRDPDRLGAANDYLRRARDLTDADEAYLIGTDGVTIAASNWNEPGSFVGFDYGFRPYFREAIAAGEAYYYAIGITTGRPGAFLSARIGPASAPRGVSVVKMEFTQLESAWTRAGETTFVVDAEGMVFLSAVPEWRFRPLAALPPQTIARLTAERRYAGLALEGARPLPIRGDRLTSAGGAMRLRLGPVAGTDWRLAVALPLAPVRDQAVLAAVFAGAAGALLAVLTVALRQRRQILRLRLDEADRLEARVEERTRALAQEIEERRRTEEKLLHTQESLIHAAKLAVLGRMSAAIVHEVGQSLSALDNNLAAAGLHGRSGDAARLATALDRARAMLRRLQGVVARLRGFGSRQVPVALVPVALAPVIQTAAELVRPSARDTGVELTLPVGDLPPLIGDAPRLEQVLTNLMLNGVEAAARAPAPRAVRVSAARAGGVVEITITDTGPGLPEALHDTVREPFFTTRGAEGMGLGLYIVQSLLEQMRGSLRYAPGPEGRGTSAIVTLPAPEEPA
ncbi:sensor histidine kinase [Paenirhodobacter sp.]|uniref:sensor histidine kinase n=1 Tax=Paenirhodobacter sp. TaxID=1965326 RepID=UPI003B421F33